MGDVIATGCAWCQLKYKGPALVGLPAGKEKICFNYHPRYGPFMYSQLNSNWKQIASEDDPEVFKQTNNYRSVKQQRYQPIQILEKIFWYII